MTEESVNGVACRYCGFFDGLDNKLDGLWSFDNGECCIIANGVYQAVWIARLDAGIARPACERVKQDSTDQRRPADGDGISVSSA